MRLINHLRLGLIGIAVTSAGVAISQCPLKNTGVDADKPSPAIDPAKISDSILTGKVMKDGSPVLGTVSVCYNSTSLGTALPVIPNGAWAASLPAGQKLVAGDVLTVQFTSGGVPGAFSTFTVPKQACSIGAASVKKPAIKLTITDPNNGSFSVTVSSATAGAQGKLIICNKDEPMGDPYIITGTSFSGTGLKPAPGDSYTAVYTTGNPGGPFTDSTAVAIPINQALVTGSVAQIPAQCKSKYSDCGWGYSVVGGVEQSDLSSQNSQTNGFADLFVRGPSTSGVYGWGQVRFLGAPNTSNTSNIVSAVSDPTGNISSSTLSTVGFAIDYVAGIEVDPRFSRPANGKYSLGFIAGVGATTPLSSQTATVAYAVPGYGTNECTQLLNRLTTANGYTTPLPGSNTITTTTTMSSGSTTPTTTTTTSPEYCSVEPIATSTVVKNTVTGVTTTTVTSGTQITNVAFAPQDRSDFLLKYYGGLRITDRILFDKTKTQCYSSDASPGSDNCARAMTDIIFGQDESITGGVLHRIVFRANVAFPIRAGLYLYGSASLRAIPNVNLDPLILTPTPPTSSGAAASSGGGVTIPSPNVFVFPLKQSDRDFYRVGIALDLSTIWSKLFTASQ